jgi:hypothetical protein
MQGWLQNISNIQRNWKLIPIVGPQQQKDDSRYERDFIANFLCLRRLDAEIPSDLDVMATRRRFFEVLSKAAAN